MHRDGHRGRDLGTSPQSEDCQGSGGRRDLSALDPFHLYFASPHLYPVGVLNLLSGLGLLVTVFALVVLGIVFSIFAGLMSLLIPADILALLVLSFTGSIPLGGLVFLVVGVLGILKLIF